MPEVNEVTWPHRELVTLLIKAAGVHEGRWMLEFKFGLTPMHSGPSPDQISPGIVVAITSVGIHREVPGAPLSLVVDAAEVNPEHAASAPIMPEQQSSRSQPDALGSSSPSEPGRPPSQTRRRRSR